MLRHLDELNGLLISFLEPLFSITSGHEAKANVRLVVPHRIASSCREILNVARLQP